MNKVFLRKDIIKSMAQQTGLSQEKCGFCLNAYHNLILSAIKSRDVIEDKGFFNISVKFVPKHVKADPRDFHNKKLNIPDKYKIVLKPMKALRDAVAQISTNNDTS